ncbi:MAG: MoaD/ThiS family protein [Proteobacteria bacterium]|nr:MoaD/ThiS family protein [Burkholderiales bacterium]
MARLIFTQQLARLTEVPDIDTRAPTLRGALESAFAANPRLRGYILDEQGHLRANVAIFIDGLRVHDRIGLDQAIGSSSSIYVMQALSGG